jgi:hypothetical protein
MIRIMKNLDEKFDIEYVTNECLSKNYCPIY